MHQKRHHVDCFIIMTAVKVTIFNASSDDTCVIVLTFLFKYEFSVVDLTVLIIITTHYIILNQAWLPLFTSSTYFKRRTF